MVATDIAARGIDIEDLSHVLNYSLPEFTEVYVHRVGRTGRIGKEGQAISFVDGKGLTTLTQLERQFGISFNTKELPEEGEVLKKRSERIMKELTEKASVAEVTQQMPVAKEILESDDGAQVVAFLLKNYFANQVKPASEPRKASPRGERSERSDRPERGDRPERAPRGEGGEEGRPRRRRRRGRRGQRGAEGSNGAYADAVDARELLDGPAPRGNRGNTNAGNSGNAGNAGNIGNGGNTVAPAPVEEPIEVPAAEDGQAHIRVNIGFGDGFKGRGAVAKKIASLAGLNDESVSEVEARRHHAVLKASPEIAELVVERVDGAQIGKKIVNVNLG
jgi:ATP-dependent RNA helicase DeaD